MPESDFAPPRTSKNGRRRVLFIGLTIVLGVTFLAGAGLFIFSLVANQAVDSQRKVQVLLSQFMGAMAQQDASTAFQLYPALARKKMDIADLEEVAANHPEIFKGYAGVTVNSVTIDPADTVHWGGRTIIIMSVNATINYVDGHVLPCEAVVQNDGGTFALLKIDW